MEFIILSVFENFKEIPNPRCYQNDLYFQAFMIDNKVKKQINGW